MSSELPRDMDSVVSLKDSASDIYKKKPIEVTEKSDVLVPGILPELGINFLKYILISANIHICIC